jgi:membrane carboxypeptidase/penicillin-binding protein
VDLVVTPSLRAWGDFMKPARDWDAPEMQEPIEVVIDMLPKEEEEEEEEEKEEEEKKEEAKEEEEEKEEDEEEDAGAQDGVED